MSLYTVRERIKDLIKHILPIAILASSLSACMVLPEESDLVKAKPSNEDITSLAYQHFFNHDGADIPIPPQNAGFSGN